MRESNLRKNSVVFSNGHEGVDPQLSTRSIFRMEFRNATEGLSFVQCLRRWALHDLNDFRLVGINLQDNGSNVYGNYESFVYSTLDIARRLRDTCFLGDRLRELARDSGYYVLKVSKKVPKAVKYSDVFTKQISDPRFSSNILIRTNTFVKLELTFLFSDRNHEGKRVLEIDDMEFYVLNEYANAVRKVNFSQDLNNEAVFHINLETFQYMNHSLIFARFIDYFRGLCDDMHVPDRLRVTDTTGLSNMGISNVTLEYLMKMGIFTVGDLRRDYKGLDMSRVSHDSLEIIGYLMDIDPKVKDDSVGDVDA